jgi:hypothetical protein
MQKIAVFLKLITLFKGEGRSHDEGNTEKENNGYVVFKLHTVYVQYIHGSARFMAVTPLLRPPPKADFLTDILRRRERFFLPPRIFASCFVFTTITRQRHEIISNYANKRQEPTYLSYSRTECVNSYSSKLLLAYEYMYCTLFSLC